MSSVAVKALHRRFFYNGACILDPALNLTAARAGLDGNGSLARDPGGFEEPWKERAGTRELPTDSLISSESARITRSNSSQVRNRSDGASLSAPIAPS
jgi:hypothetical protein